ncbi:methyltransferase domain-containing protein [Candidatus Peregrinibacteria bacterium]|nr:MAG: methyltransferase domain-containing protein [Candidatus Peregrinibacteria bacterium]
MHRSYGERVAELNTILGLSGTEQGKIEMIRQKLTEVLRDENARFWELYAQFAYQTVTEMQAYQAHIRRILSNLDLEGMSSGGFLVDLGCGMGNLIEEASKIAPQKTHLMGVDRNPAMLRWAEVRRERINQTLSGGPSIDLIQASIDPSLALPLNTNRVSMVNSLYALGNDQSAVLEAIYQQVNPGAKLLICDRNPGGTIGGVLYEEWQRRLGNSIENLMLPDEWDTNDGEKLIELIHTVFGEESERKAHLIVAIFNQIIASANGGHQMHFSEPEQLKKIIESAGFRVTDKPKLTYGNSCTIVTGQKVE